MTPMRATRIEQVRTPLLQLPEVAGGNTLQWMSIVAAAALHAFALGYALAAVNLSSGSHGEMIEAIGVEVVLNDIVAARDQAKETSGGTPLPLAATEGVAATTTPMPAAIPDRREREGDVAAAAPIEQGPSVLAAPEAPEAVAGPAETQPRSEAQPVEAVPQVSPQPRPQATTTARLDPEPAPDRQPRPQSRPSSAGGSASEAKRNAAMAPARAAATAGEVSGYAALVRARIAARKPSAAGLRGSPSVSFAIGPSGALSYVRIGKSSGHARLDELALRSVRAAAPFPAPPGGLSAAQLSYRIPFHFE